MAMSDIYLVDSLAAVQIILVVLPAWLVYYAGSHPKNPATGKFAKKRNYGYFGAWAAAILGVLLPIGVAIKTNGDDLIASSTQENTKRILLDDKVLKAVAEQNDASQKLSDESIKIQDKYENELSRRQIRETSTQQQNLILRSNIKATAQSAYSLSQTLNGIDRTLNPVGDVIFSIQIFAPLSNPGLSDYRKELFARYEQFVLDTKNGKKLDENPDFAYATNFCRGPNGHMVMQHGWLIKEGSALMPTESNPYGNLLYYKTDLLFWPSLSGPNIPAQLRSLRASKLPDVELSTNRSLTRPELFFLPQTQQLYLSYTGMVPVDKPTDRPISLPDLLGTEVQVTRSAFYSKKNLYSDLPVPYLEGFYVESVRLSINGQPFYFDKFDLKHYQDKVYGDACYFTFQRNVDELADYKERQNR